MKKISKILSIILSIMMIISIIPLTASAATSGICGDNLTWEYDELTRTLTISGTGAMYDYDYYNRPWESYKYSIKTVVINNGVTTIGNYAFYLYTDLTDVTIPDSVTTIGDYAFERCEKLTSVTIPDSVTMIGNSAFSCCWSLISVTIPDSVTLIGRFAFSGCEKLISITVDSNNQYYSSDEDGVLFNKDKTEIIQYPIGNARINYTTPNSVTSIGEGSFGGSIKLRNIIIGDSVTIIGDTAFAGCLVLTSVTIGNGVTTIGDGAFAECENITNVTIPDSVTTIGDCAFAGLFSLNDVCYLGSSEQWNNIIVGESNNDLIYSAYIHYHHENYINNHVITLPTCTEKGYTTYSYECNCSYNDNYIDATGHKLEWVTLSVASCNTNGVKHGYCENCSYFEVETTSMTRHEYNPIITAPTCNEQGYRTYICTCGDSYVEDYVEATGHNYTWSTLTEETCTTNGVSLGICENCNAASVNYTDATGHNMVDGDCTNCDYTENVQEDPSDDPTDEPTDDPIEEPTEDPVDDCTCNCHKSGFFFKFILFFQKLFGTNKTCSCGVAHY